MQTLFQRAEHDFPRPLRRYDHWRDLAHRARSLVSTRGWGWLGGLDLHSGLLFASYFVCLGLDGNWLNWFGLNGLCREFGADLLLSCHIRLNQWHARWIRLRQHLRDGRHYLDRLRRHLRLDGRLPQLVKQNVSFFVARTADAAEALDM